MSKYGNFKSEGSAGILCCTVLLLCLAAPAYCEQGGSALMLELSPSNGGRVNLAPGVHTFDRDSEVSLAAVPNPGYRFVYWLGDVTDAAANSTVVFLDTPKIVIAVFERSEYAFVDASEGMQPSIGGGGLSPSVAESYPHDVTPREDKREYPPPPLEPDFPVPTPEPTTIVLLGAGSLMLAEYRRRRKGGVA